MKNNHINQLFEAISPTENQKENMWTAIERQRLVAHEPSQEIHRRASYRKILISLSASLLILLISATAYAAVSGDIEKLYDRYFNGKGQTVTFANGDTSHYEIEGRNMKVTISPHNGPWLVQKSWGRLIVSVNGEKINISEALKKKGYFYYSYRDDTNILHRLYIVRNAGGTKDYAERWYSQMDWLPELGMSGGVRGLSQELAMAIGGANLDAEEGKDLDAALKDRLEKYWKEYGN
ncbi:hypothetical protein [Gorillibacterium sp. CAU 1737]|uniref:hypothetical protein n=1 Tax=Gorillibacterium sp. CAU 1737 TaxID=3140362 RepID=UPI0032608FEA